MRFITPVFHPNVDRDGRICLDVLKMPPSGAWSPALSIISVLQCVRGLLLDPNPNDPLDAGKSMCFMFGLKCMI